jgi:predicted flap endonuclease-1-like 5' DNA nuclease
MGAAGRKGEFLLLGRPRHLFSLLAWSAVVWIFYELLNFRLQNWYYVNVPTSLPIRWVSTVVAFASVLPAVFLSFTLMRGLGVAKNTRWKPFDMSHRLHWLRIAGAIMMGLVLIWPKYFYALVWGATTLLVEPWVYQKRPDRSLLHDLERGDPGRLLRLLAGGVLIGFLWESLNILARAKWIYTVPGLEDLKIFEMPMLGFLGFPPFTLECFVLWQALVVAGVALPRDGVRHAAPMTRRAWAPALAIAFCAAVLWQMDRVTFASYSPNLAAVAGASAPALQSAGLDVYRLAQSTPAEVAGQLGVADDSAEALIRNARLVTLRGIGTHYAALLNKAGVYSVDDLARADPKDLAGKLEVDGGEKVNAARIRIWIKGARHAVERAAR